MNRRAVIVLAVRYGWATVAPILPAVSVAASEQPPVLPAILEFDHDGRDVTGFVLYATRREDGAVRRIDVGMAKKAKSGRWQVAIPTLETGTWRLELAAYNAAGESPRAKPNPSEVRSDATAPAATSEPKPPSAQHAPATRHKNKKGLFGKLWTVIVGDDGP